MAYPFYYTHRKKEREEKEKQIEREKNEIWTSNFLEKNKIETSLIKNPIFKKETREIQEKIEGKRVAFHG